MKTKLLALIMALVMIVACLASCGGTTTPPAGGGGGGGTTPPGGGGSGSGGGGTADYNWDETTLHFEMTDNSNNEELSSSCKRYLAGLEGEDEPIDEKIAERNDAAYDVTNVKVLYDVKPDTSNYNWSKNISRIERQVFSYDDESPDIYCNFIYDMVSCSLMKCFANLYSKSRGEGELNGVNYFEFADANYVDDGEGYMYEYMKTLTLSKSKMYCLSSDYFTDMVRAFFVVPVNIAELESITVATEDGKFNSDRTGDGDFTIADFYKLVNDGEWTYETLAQFGMPGAYGAQGEDNDTTDLRDKVAFAISTSSGLSASGMLYTSSVTIINRDPDDTAFNNYRYSYPEPESAEANALYTYCNNLNTLFKTPYIITVGTGEEFGYGTDSLQAIRNQFKAGNVLFGGVICVGSLEYDEYQALNAPDKKGFGIAPVPVYQAGDKYQTQIHNIGRIGAISSTTKKFAQCSAFLDYQSQNSTQILNDYYRQHLQYGAAGGNKDNVDMLNYIRENVRSSFDKAFEDAIGKFFQVTDTDSNADKWHIMLMNNKFQMTNMPDEYKRVYDKKAGKLATLEAEYEGLPD